MCELNDMDYDEDEAYDEDNIYWSNYGTPQKSKKLLVFPGVSIIS